MLNMAESSSQTVTRRLEEIGGGEGGSCFQESSFKQEAEEELYEAVYTELRRRAHQQRKRWKGEPTLRTTALVHEAYLKLVHEKEQSWQSRSHFLAVAGKAMRHILIDRARRKRAQKRGGSTRDLSLEELREKLGREVALADEDAEAFLVLEEALGELEKTHPRAARVVECRFFAGMTIKATATALSVSTATVSRDWKQAKAWLYREMKRIRGEEPEDRSSQSGASGSERSSTNA